MLVLLLAPLAIEAPRHQCANAPVHRDIKASRRRRSRYGYHSSRSRSQQTGHQATSRARLRVRCQPQREEAAKERDIPCDAALSVIRSPSRVLSCLLPKMPGITPRRKYANIDLVSTVANSLAHRLHPPQDHSSSIDKVLDVGFSSASLIGYLETAVATKRGSSSQGEDAAPYQEGDICLDSRVDSLLGPCRPSKPRLCLIDHIVC